MQNKMVILLTLLSILIGSSKVLARGPAVENFIEIRTNQKSPKVDKAHPPGQYNFSKSNSSRGPASTIETQLQQAEPTFGLSLLLLIAAIIFLPFIVYQAIIFSLGRHKYVITDETELQASPKKDNNDNDNSNGFDQAS